MKSSYTGAELANAADARRQEIHRQLQELGAEMNQFKQQRAALVEEAKKADAALGTKLLPDLTPTSYLTLQALTGFDEFLRDDPAQARDRERHELSQRLATFQRDRRYPDLADHHADVSRRVQQLEAERAPAESLVADSQHERLKHLLDVGYGTPEYSVPFWRMSYYADWKARDEILAKFPELGEDFGQFRSAYFEARSTVIRSEEALQPLLAELSGLTQFKTQVDQVESNLATLDARAIEAARRKAIEHVLGSDATRARAENTPELASLVKKFDGLQHKIRYLDELAGKELNGLHQELVAENTALTSDTMKWRRPKKAYLAFPAAIFEKRFVERPRKRWGRLDRYRKTQQSVYGFTDYDRASFAGDLLWWDVMTDGRFDGDFIDEVSTFRSTHPSYAWMRNNRSEADAAAAIAGEQRRRARGEEEDDIS